MKPQHLTLNEIINEIYHSDNELAKALLKNMDAFTNLESEYGQELSDLTDEVEYTNDCLNALVHSLEALDPKDSDYANKVTECLDNAGVY